MWFFVTDLHGKSRRYNLLFEKIKNEEPEAVLIGGDILPFSYAGTADTKAGPDYFLSIYLREQLTKLQKAMEEKYPRILVIMGNDDAKIFEKRLYELESDNLLEYINLKFRNISGFDVAGYSYNPPSPFQLKDWEKYDVSQYVDPGCTHPTAGFRSIKLPENKIKYSTIKDDLKEIADKKNLKKTIFLFHSPPYNTKLDRAALDGKKVAHVPLDVHVGSIAIQRFIKKEQPLLTLHGHIHESTRLTEKWQDKIGNTYCFNGAGEKSELVLIKFKPEQPEKAEREIL